MTYLEMWPLRRGHFIGTPLRVAGYLCGWECSSEAGALADWLEK